MSQNAQAFGFKGKKKMEFCSGMVGMKILGYFVGVGIAAKNRLEYAYRESTNMLKICIYNGISLKTDMV